MLLILTKKFSWKWLPLQVLKRFLSRESHFPDPTRLFQIFGNKGCAIVSIWEQRTCYILSVSYRNITAALSLLNKAWNYIYSRQKMYCKQGRHGIFCSIKYFTDTLSIVSFSECKEDLELVCGPPDGGHGDIPADRSNQRPIRGRSAALG